MKAMNEASEQRQATNNAACGHASRPVSAQKVLDKFHANAARSLAPVMADRITGFWLNIDKQSGFGGLADSLMASRNLS